MKNMSGKCGVITGAASGLGYGLALALADKGMNLVIADWNGEGAERTAAEVKNRGVDAVAVETDVASSDAVDRLADLAYERFGSVQLLVNNAAVSTHGPLWQTSAADWEWIVGVNVLGVVNGLRAFLPRMTAQADERHVAITASINGLWSMRDQGAYNTTKSALIGMGDALARDLAGSGITVSLICPGPMRTGLGQNSRPPSLGGATLGKRSESDRPEELQRMLATWPMLTSEQAGRIVCHELEQDEFWILTHEEGLDEVDARYQGLREAYGRRAARTPAIQAMLEGG